MNGSVKSNNRVPAVSAGAAALLGVLLTQAVGARSQAVVATAPNPSGTSSSILTAGADPQNPFFQSLGTNGRTCATCHDAQDCWTVTPEHLQARFAATSGLDPVFRPHDGAVSPNADVSTPEARQAAYALLLKRGLFRVDERVPESAEFTVAAVDDPYGFATPGELSLFRRALPATNLPYLKTVMWDGRETVPGTTLSQQLQSQANHATLGHAQATGALAPGTLQQIVNFEASTFTAQSADVVAGPLLGHGGHGGPQTLVKGGQLKVNDPFTEGSRFNPNVFTLYNAWSQIPASAKGQNAQRRLIGMGQKIFNTRKFVMGGVRGLNDVLGQSQVVVTCSSCHNVPNVGSRSVEGGFDLTLRMFMPRDTDLPLYTLRNNSTGEEITTADPGRAMVTGKWSDVAKFKVPILRGLASRAPYFHDGSAKRIEDVVQFYYDRFNITAGPQEKEALAAFLKAL